MDPLVQRRRRRIAIFAASLERQNRRQDPLQPTCRLRQIHPELCHAPGGLSAIRRRRIGSTPQLDPGLAHLYSAFAVSPFEEANVVSIDGFGDFSSTAWGIGRGDTLSVDGRVYFPHSLGAFYEAITQYLGFPNYGDEYKVMGLAPYGEPAYLDAMREIVHLLPNGRSGETQIADCNSSTAGAG